MHATGQGRKSDGECASLATARTEDLAAKVQGLSLRLLRIYLMFDLSLPGGYAPQTFAGFTRCLRVTHAMESGVTDHVGSPEEVVAILVDRR